MQNVWRELRPGPKIPDIVYAIVVQPDGKILFGGTFWQQYDGVDRAGIARANTDGSIDTSFDPGNGANGTVYAIYLQSDGRVLVGGAFNQFNGSARLGIARLNANGSLDASFDPGAGANDLVYAVARQSDGKALIGGAFTAYDGVTRNRVARLNEFNYYLYLPAILKNY